jgi:hypothetical protein
MEAVSDKAFGALGQFPIVQAAVATLIVLAGVYMIFRGSKEKNNPSSPEHIPQWLMIGPMHNMMEEVRHIAEQGRRTNDLLRECREAANACKAILELIRNESRLR